MDRRVQNRGASSGRRSYAPERRRASTSPADAPTTLVGSGAPEPSDDYDPGDHSVADVLAFVEQNPDMARAVLKRERKGKARAGIVNKLG